MRFIFIVALSSFLFIGCDSEAPENTLLVGTYRALDQLIPYPFILHQKNDSVALFDNQGVLIERIKNRSIEGKSFLKFKSKHLRISEIDEQTFTSFDVLDTINFRGFKSRAQFKTLKYNQNFTVDSIKKTLSETVFKYDVIEDENSNPNRDFEIEQLWYFEKDSANVITNYYYRGQKTISEYETKAYSVFNIENISFLSFQKENNNPQPIFQIINHDSVSIVLKDFSSRESKTIQFKKSTITTNDYLEILKFTTYYSNCFDGYQGEYYYGEDATYSKGNQYIIDVISKDAPKIDDKSGYIIVHYTLNCEGQLGRFGLIQISRGFQTMIFSEEMVNHILVNVRGLEAWPNNFETLDWLGYKDVHGFLMFKIENGKITDVCP